MPDRREDESDQEHPETVDLRSEVEGLPSTPSQGTRFVRESTPMVEDADISVQLDNLTTQQRRFLTLYALFGADLVWRFYRQDTEADLIKLFQFRAVAREVAVKARQRFL